MSTRFHLRFENGERKGELVPVPRSGLLVGRRPGNDLRLDASSVSGRHALLRPDGDVLRVEDMGSTNGTRVDSERVENATATHGQTVVFGDVRFEVVDAEAVPALQETASRPAPAPVTDDAGGFDLEEEIELGSAEPTAPAMPAQSLPAESPRTEPPAGSATPPPPSASSGRASTTPAPSTAPEPVAVDPDVAGEELLTIDDAALSRTKGNRVTTLAVLAILVAGVGATAWYFLGQGADDGGVATSVVRVRDGDLLGGSDLESNAEDLLEILDGSSVRLFEDRAAAASGELGLSAEFGADDVLVARSATVTVRPGEAFAAVGTFESDLPVAVGLELLASDGSRSVTTWDRVANTDRQWVELHARGLVRPGFDSARLWVAAGPFSGDEEELRELFLDELGIVPSGEPAVDVDELGAFGLEVALPSRESVTLYHAYTPLLTIRATAGREVTSNAAPLSVVTDGARPRVEPEGPADVITVLAMQGLVGEDGRALATQGADGFRRRIESFEQDSITALVLGADQTLTRLVFDEPAMVRARQVDAGVRLELELGGGGFDVQTDFSAELSAAVKLANEARSAEREGRLGDALALWRTLRDDYPYQDEYLDEGEATRGRLVSSGLDDLRALEEELTRARFFALTGVYDRCDGLARDIVERFVPSEAGMHESEVAIRATELLAQIQAERAALGNDSSALEPERRERILDWLERNEAQGLADRLRTDS